MYARKSKDTKLQMKDIKFCSSCAKPLAGEYYTVLNRLNGKTIWHYHNSVAECVNAPAIKKDWRRSERRESIEENIGLRTYLPGVDGHPGDANNDMSVWFEGVES